MTSSSLYLTAKEAAAELGVSLATLYAYVSRGLVRSEARPGMRAKLYLAEDVRALARRGEPSQEAAAQRALSGGGPVLDSALTLIAGGRLYYRGHDVADLAASFTLESVASLLWFGDTPAAEVFLDVGWELAPGLDTAFAAGLPPLQRAQCLLAAASALDSQAHNQTTEGLARTGARIVRGIAGAVSGAEPTPTTTGLPVHEYLARTWSLPRVAADLLRTALVLVADHELNASTFAVRVAASTGATIHEAVLTGLAVLSGPRHGGMAERAAALLRQWAATDDPARAAAEHVGRGDPAPGFGLALYPGGDPRGRILLERVARAYPEEAAVQRMLDAIRTAERLTGHPATDDMGIGLLVTALGLPPGAALGLFAIGRSVGWVGHYMEQSASGPTIRPRARYVGPHPR